MAGSFDFCPSRQVITEIPPDEVSAVSFKGWIATSKPSVPYNPKFKVTLHGLRWYLSGGALDITTNPTFNAGRLRKFYIDNRLWDTFTWAHETLGTLTCKFTAPAVPPPAEANAGGLIAAFEVMLIQSNPGY